MPATTVKVHPAIGIARLGNSPDEFFIGPETADEPPIPQNGYKDAACRVKRQGARFRVFSYDENGAVLDEITAAEANIVWKVELANRKASGLRFIGSTERNPSITGADRALLDITPGLKTVTGPNQVVDIAAPFQVAGQAAMSVKLGQLRTDPDGRLIVLGGHGVSASPVTTNVASWSDNDTWHDDVSDGYVKATITLHATGEVFEAVAAWVIVAPPKFAPPIYNAITLYDTVFQFCRDLPAGHPAKVSLPAQCSFRRDIYPILQSASDVHGVVNVSGAHSSFGPNQYPLSLAQRVAVFGFLRGPGVSGSMPKLQQSPALTQTQYQQLTRWKDGAAEFVDDWDPALPATPITPEALDRGPLSHSVGAAFFPGIEAGAFMTSAANIYLEPLRLDPAVVSPGDVTRRMALPWQADFKACASGSSTAWWPVNRPNDVHPQSDPNGYEPWDADIGSLSEMVAEWHQAGFVVRSGSNLVLTEKCATKSVSLLTPELDFGDVQQNPLSQPGQMALPVTFEVLSPTAAVTLQVATPPSDPAFATLGNTQVTVGPTGATTPAKAYLWMVFTTGTVGQVSSGDVVVEEVGTGQTWTVSLVARTVERQKAAVCLVLDRSGSMSDPSGSVTKIQAMQQAANLFINSALAEDGVGIVSYSSNATAHGSSVTALDALGGFAGPRDVLSAVVNGLTPTGGTSIGDGLEQATAVLSASAGYAKKATVVLTDGVETAPKYIADVAGLVTSQTFGIGFGEPSNVNVSTLATLTGNHGGYLLVTGPVTDDNQFLLKKYFLQILAGVSNADIVLDPTGRVVPGRIHRIPFRLTEDDYGVDVILLCNPMRPVVMGVETPSGEIITLGDADGVAVQSVRTEQHTLLRLRLPTLFTERVGHGGQWHVLFGMLRRDGSRGTTGTNYVVGASARRVEPEGDGRAYVASTRAPAATGDKGDLLALLTAPREPRERDARLRRLQSLASLMAAEHASPRARLSSTAAVPRAGAVAQPAAAAQLGPPYSVLVHAYSHLRLRAELLQSDFEPGAKVGVLARLSRVGMPFDGTASIFAEVTQPGGLPTTVPLSQGADGGWAGSFTALQVGVHSVRVRATGRTIRNEAFTRELTLSAGIARGANSYVPPRDSGEGGQPSGPDKKACAALLCMLENGLFSKPLEAALARIGLNLEVARRCLRKYCATSGGGRDLDRIVDALQGVLRPSEASEP